MSRPLGLTDFAAAVGRSAVLHVGDDAIDAEVTEAVPASGDGGPRGFSVYFRLPPGVALEQGTYAVELPSTPPVPIFLVPISQDDGGLTLEAVFG